MFDVLSEGLHLGKWDSVYNSFALFSPLGLFFFFLNTFVFVDVKVFTDFFSLVVYMQIAYMELYNISNTLFMYEAVFCFVPPCYIVTLLCSLQFNKEDSITGYCCRVHVNKTC